MNYCVEEDEVLKMEPASAIGGFQGLNQKLEAGKPGSLSKRAPSATLSWSFTKLVLNISDRFPYI